MCTGLCNQGRRVGTIIPQGLPCTRLGQDACNSLAKQFLARNFCDVPPTAAGENGTVRGQKLCETCGPYFPRPQIFKRDIDRAVFYCSTLRGVGFSSERPLPTTFISKNQRAVSTRAPSGESFAATTNLRWENQLPNLHRRRIATSAP